MEEKEFIDKGFSVVKRVHLIFTVAAFFVTTGIGIGISQTQLAAKLDEAQTRKVVKEEIVNEMKHYCSDVDGQVLKIEVENLQKQIDRLEKLLEKLN